MFLKALKQKKYLTTIQSVTQNIMCPAKGIFSTHQFLIEKAMCFLHKHYGRHIDDFNIYYFPVWFLYVCF